MKEINDVLMRALRRLDDNELMKTKGNEEIARSNAISKTAQAVVNVVKTNLTIMQVAKQTKQTIDKVKTNCDL